MFAVALLMKTFARMRGATPSERNFRKQLYFGLAITFVPPACVAGLYFYASTTGCSGGDCAGAMLLVGLLGLLSVGTTLTGLVWLLIISIDKLFQMLRGPSAC